MQKNICVDDVIDFVFDENDSDSNFDSELDAEIYVSCLFFSNMCFFLARIGSFFTKIWWRLWKSTENNQSAHS